jgi:hypothetical protein
VPLITHAVGLSPLEGESLLARDPEAGRTVFAETLGGRATFQSVERDGWKLIYNWAGVLKLYDRSHDPTERNDVYDEQPIRAQELWKLLKPRVDALAGISGEVPIEMN